VNVYVPARYDERVVHLALGVSPLDADSGSRLPDGVDVRIERFPRPVDQWRPWRPGETLTGALPRMPRHRSGRFALLYGEDVPTSVTFRVVDDAVLGATRVPGLGRRIVPRRVRVTIADEATVLAAEADPATPPHPLWQRMVPLSCFPGAAAPISSRSTVLRGRVVRLDATTGDLVPVRWARVQATDAAGDDLGWAHGDDRGEFALVVRPSPNDVVVPVDPTPATLTVGVILPPAAPDPADPTLARVDPLWDLPVETLTLAADPTTQSSLTGRRFLPGQSVLSPLSPSNPIELPHGRETSVVIRIA
jgi:hypothetical protein